MSRIGAATSITTAKIDVSGLIAKAHSGRGFEAAALARELANLPPAQAARARQAIEAKLSPVERGQLARAEQGLVKPDLKKLGLDVTQVALDIIGIFEPTPFADLANAGISALRGDWVGAGLSVVGVVPYVGDLAKAGKLGRWAKTISNAVDAAISNSAARRALQPMLTKVGQAIDNIPAAAFNKLPADMQAKLRGLRRQIDSVTTVVGREVRAGVNSAAKRLGVDPAKLDAVVAAPRGSRPAVSSYMTAAQQRAHLAAFDDGIVRVTSRTALNKYGSLGPNGGFVTSLKDFKAIMAEAKGDLRIVEKRLGLDPGTLSNKDTLIAVIDPKNAPSLRVPSGNEGGANSRWVPGGYTSGNVIEAVMDFKPGQAYRELTLKR